MPPVIRLDKLSKRFGPHVALNEVSFEVPPGTVFALLGDNGAGKTTAIRIMLGLLEANSGKAEVLGLDSATAGLEIRQRVGYVSERPTLYEWMTIEEIGWFAAGFYDDEYLPRYRRLIEATIDISLRHLPRNKYSGIYYLRLGDMVSGDIHQELRETNELSGVAAVPRLVALETWGIKQLVDAFKHVHVVSVPGNHGRTTLKPPSKRIEENYDWLSACWLEDVLRDDSRITWQTPKSTDAVFEIFGRKYLATHGDNIGTKGGQGFVGPAAPIHRGATLTLREYAARRLDVEKMFIGHFHTALDFGRGWSNGSLPGYSEYARRGRMTPEPPQQWLIMFHPKRADTSAWKVRLEEPK
jgi:ABC-type Fe3+/spermidine/putrescine transport system ATPase subunit